MANKKISALPTATVPLTGTEVLPVVQSGVTDQVSVANLTAGRAVTMLSNTMSSASAVNDVDKTGGGSYSYRAKGNDQANVRFRFENTNGQIYELVGGNPGASNSGFCIFDATSSAKRMYIDSAGDITFNTGNLIVGTAGKGIDFSANTHAAGMTSELLDWYEEGDWTPNQGSGLTVVGAFSSSGKYTRTGRQVTVTGQVNGATSVLVSASGVISTNLPFTSGVNTLGVATNSALSVVGGVFVSSGTTNLSSTVAIGATSTIYFQATYFV